MNRDLLSRGAGVLLIAVGCILAYWAVYEPLELARTGAAEISYRMKGVFVVPFGFLFGLAYLIGGAKADTLLRVQDGGQRLTKWGWGLAIVSVALGGLVYWWFDNQLTALGYVQA